MKKKFLENFRNFDYVCEMNDATTFEEFMNMQILQMRYDRKLNKKYYMTLKSIMTRDQERRKMGGSKSIHNFYAVNSSQQG